MSKIKDIFHKQSQPRISAKVAEYATPLRMGIEVELEGWQHEEAPTAVAKDWNLIRDASLRNEGMEFVLRSPKHGKPLIKALNNLGSFLNQNSFSMSHRCSVHCHLDFRDADTDTLERFFLLYMLLEPALYTMSSKDRYNNIYCPGLSHATGQVHEAAVAFAQRNFVRLASDWNKYTGINLRALIDLGSVEIRTHEGTGSSEELILWTRVLNYVFHAASTLDIEDIYKVSSPDELVDMVFGDCTDLVELMTCENLHVFWSNVMLNLQYYKLVPQVLSTCRERPMHDTLPHTEDTEIDFNLVDSEIAAIAAGG